VSLSTTRITSGDSVTVTPATSGDLWGATYNYVWQRDGSWAEGDWGSTELFEGHGVPGALYRLRWASADGSASGTLSDWSSASSIWFNASALGDCGDFYVVMDAVYPMGRPTALPLAPSSI
jgi:hypothetical protein